MSSHIFKVGNIVSYSSSIGQSDDSPYEVTRLLPSDGPEPSYRLRSVAGSRERVAQQHELRLARPPTTLETDEPRQARPAAGARRKDRPQ